jgi:hypothetical protein
LIRTRLWTIVAFVVACVIPTILLHAQTPFASPEGTIDWAVYTTPESCFAAVQREQIMDAASRGKRLDTMSYDPLASVPIAVAKTARTCLSRLDLASIPVNSFESLFHTALLSDDDSLVRAIMARGIHTIASLSHESDSMKVHDALVIEEAIIQGLTDVQPVRLPTARQFATMVDTLFPQKNLHGRIYPSFQLLTYAGRVLDHDLTVTLAQHIIDMLEHAPSTISAVDRQHIPEEITAMRAVLADAKLFQMTPQAAAQQLASVGLRTAPGPLIGKPAPRVMGDFWFDTDSTPQPRRGRVSLLVFVTPEVATEESFGVLRRMQHTFPALNIVLMAQTHGYVRHRVAESPATEANVLHDFFHNVVHLPGALSVSVTPYTNLPAPDGRRIEGLTANQRALGGVEMCVVNQQGIVVYQGRLSALNERMLDAIISVLLEA